MYFTDAGIEELDDRRGDEQVSVSWLAERLRDFVDLNPEFETAVDRLASWLARLDADSESDGGGSEDEEIRVKPLSGTVSWRLPGVPQTRYILTSLVCDISYGETVVAPGRMCHAALDR
jgi:hypothetical protein